MIINNKNIRICFINPPSPFLINPEVFPPLGLLSLATAAINDGYNEIEFVDLAGSVDLKKDLYMKKADIFFISAGTPQIDIARECVVELRKYNITSKFVIGGPHSTVKYDDCFFVDSIVQGDGEDVILEILHSFPNLKRIYIGYIDDLNRIPNINRNFINIKKYAKNYLLDGRPTTTYVTSRGCSYGKCAFCSRYTKGVRYKSAQKIYDEVNDVRKMYGITGAMFFDDEFVSNKPRLREFCKLVIENNLNIRWRCLARVNSIDDKTVIMMKKAGCVEIAIGIESADEKIINTIAKGIKLDDAKRAIKIIKKNNIHVKELFIIGLPGESPQTIQKIDDFVRTTEPYDVDFTILSVFPGSEIYNHPENFDIKFDPKCYGNYKGVPGTYDHLCKISTSQMTFEDLVMARDNLEEKYKPKEKLA